MLSVCFKGVCVYLDLRCVSVMCGIVDSTSCPSALITHMSHSVSKCFLVGVCGYLSFNFPWLHNNHDKLFVCLFVNLFHVSLFIFIYVDYCNCIFFNMNYMWECVYLFGWVTVSLITVAL